MNLSDKIKEAKQILTNAIEQYKPRAIFALFSGGHDSVTATHFAVENAPVTAIAHINTGIGIRQTREDYVYPMSERFGCLLKEYRAVDNVRKDGSPDPQIYRELVLERGFPGPPQHQKMYDRLKGRQVARLVRDHKQNRNDKIMLISGCRQEESMRRMGHVKRTQVEGARVWVAPLIHFTKFDVREYLTLHNIPRNPVVEKLKMSGECLCGAYAKPGELARIGQHYPETAKEIEALQSEVNAAGFPWGWEQGQPEWFGKWQDGQDFLSDDFMPLCMSCPSRRI